MSKNKWIWINLAMFTVSYYILNFFLFTFLLGSYLHINMTAEQLAGISTLVFLACRIPYTMYILQIEKVRDQMIERDKEKSPLADDEEGWND